MPIHIHGRPPQPQQQEEQEESDLGQAWVSGLTGPMALPTEARLGERCARWPELRISGLTPPRKSDEPTGGGSKRRNYSRGRDQYWSKQAWVAWEAPGAWNPPTKHSRVAPWSQSAGSSSGYGREQSADCPRGQKRPAYQTGQTDDTAPVAIVPDHREPNLLFPVINYVV